MSTRFTRTRTNKPRNPKVFHEGKTLKYDTVKLKRNDKCVCNSGKKNKRCCNIKR